MKKYLNEKIIFSLQNVLKIENFPVSKNFYKKTECSRFYLNRKEGSNLFQMFLETPFNFFIFLFLYNTNPICICVIQRQKVWGRGILSPQEQIFLLFSEQCEFYFQKKKIRRKLQKISSAGNKQRKITFLESGRRRFIIFFLTDDHLIIGMN